VTAFTDRLGEVEARLARAAGRSGRPGSSVTLVAVSKGHPAAAAEQALAAGLRHFGENYVREALPKLAACHRDAIWHFIGRIQSNKTREIAEHFSWAQTVTSARIAERLSVQRPHYGPALQVCIQVRPAWAATGQAADRGGCPPGEAATLATAIESLPRLKLRGLMLIPYPGLDPETLRMEYRAARALFDDLRSRGHDLDTLSMGMSDDFEVAIEAGSTMVRVGTALFGQRPDPAADREGP
jgi:PLP dependent protein